MNNDCVSRMATVPIDEKCVVALIVMRPIAYILYYSWEIVLPPDQRSARYRDHAKEKD